MIYLLNFNLIYIIIFATCFDSYESSSGINFQELLYILFYTFSVLQFFVFFLVCFFVTVRQKL